MELINQAGDGKDREIFDGNVGPSAYQLVRLKRESNSWGLGSYLSPQLKCPHLPSVCVWESVHASLCFPACLSTGCTGPVSALDASKKSLEALNHNGLQEA